MTALEDAAAQLAAGDPRGALAQAGAVLASLDVEAVACRVVIGRCHQALADPRAARATFEQAHETAVALGEPLLAAATLGAIATQDRIEGRYDDAAHHGGTAIAEAIRARRCNDMTPTVGAQSAAEGAR